MFPFPPYAFGNPAAMGGFTPASIATLKLWLDPDSIGGADGDRISSFTDLSGQGNTATASGTARPTLKTGIINGRSVLRYDGVANFMESPLGNTGTTGTLFVVGWLRSLTANSGFFNQHAATGDDFDTGHWTIYEGATGTDIGPYSNSALPGFSTFSTAAAFVFSTRFDGVNSMSRLNANQSLDGAFSGTFAATRTGIGARFTSGSYNTFNQIDLATILFYGGGLSDANSLLVENWLRARYGL